MFSKLQSLDRLFQMFSTFLPNICEHPNYTQFLSSLPSNRFPVPSAFPFNIFINTVSNLRQVLYSKLFSIKFQPSATFLPTLQLAMTFSQFEERAFGKNRC